MLAPPIGLGHGLANFAPHTKNFDIHMTKIYSYPKLRGATRMRRCAATLLAAALAVAPIGALAADGTTSHVHKAADNSVLPKCSGCDNYLIGNAADLAEFTARVNGGTVNISVAMTDDITLNADLLANLNANGTPKTGYTPVASKPIAPSYDGRYTGTFDGGGHSITGLYMTSMSDAVALFVYVGTGGMVKGVTVKDSYVYSTNNIASGMVIYNYGAMADCHVSGGVVYSVSSMACGICHTSRGARIENSTNSANVRGGYGAVGICNESYNSDGITGCITGCSNSGDVTAGNNNGSASGICGETSTPISNCTNSGKVSSGGHYAAGICQSAQNATITDCTNSGDVESQGIAPYFPGIAGICVRAKNTKISRCVNSGSVSTSVSSDKCDGYVAGICLESSGGSVISHCENKGKVEIRPSAKGYYKYGYYASGICSVQKEKGTIADCANSGELGGNLLSGICGKNTSGSILRCGNTASFEASLQGAGSSSNKVDPYFRAAGICCESTSSSTISDCYNTGNLTALAYKSFGTSTSADKPSVVAGISFGADGKGVVENCFSMGTLTLDHDGDDEHNKIFPVSPTGTNCYYTRLAGSAATDQDGIEGRDEADFQSGAVAYALNGCTSADDAVWRQNLQSDRHPRLAIDGAEAIVYAARHLRCDGKTPIAADTHYSNDAADAKADVVDAHQFGDLTPDTPDAETQNLYSVLCDNCLAATSPDTKLIKHLYGNGHDIRISSNNNSTSWVAEQPVDIADLGDATPYLAPVAFEVPKASYKRAMTGNWGTLCLPFAFEADDNDADLAFYEPTSVSADCVSLTRRTGTIPAATPLFVWSRGAAQLDIVATEPATMATAPADGASADGLQLTGAFAPTDISSGYILSGNSLWDVTTLTGKARAGAFRAYLLATTAQQSAPRLALAIDGAATAIDNLNAADEGRAEIYDATGRRTDRLQRGVNIVRRGGKTMKVSVK